MTTTVGRGAVGGGRVLRVLAAVGFMALALGPMRPLHAQGVTRELTCRGNTGMVLRVDEDPSPRNPAYVVMLLEYARSTKALNGDRRALDPGTCTWNPFGTSPMPAEPGRVRFDVLREAQPWSATERREIDTTYRAAVFHPDPISLPRYLLDPRHYWKFYVNDVSNLSVSHRAEFESGTPTKVWITGPVQLANDLRRDLLCRGGTSGLLYGGGASAGNNLAKVQLTYRVSPTVPGPTGSGLAPGSCAWTSRTAMPPEPGKIWFITASNAQLRQTQSGVPLDQSPTAAERYPDVRSIPEYLKDPSHYWTFAVVSRDPDSAVTNGPWKPDLTFATGSAQNAGTATVRTQPPTGSVLQPYSPGAATTTTRAGTLYDIRNVSVTPALEGVVIRFEAAPNITPIVTVTPASVGAATRLAVGGAPAGTMWRYSAASNTKLLRNTTYNYTISAPATGNARANMKSGTFKTLGQNLTVAISQIYVISDGDKDGNGEWKVDFRPCPRDPLNPVFLSREGAGLDWGEGPHPVSVELKDASGRTPDRMRIVTWVFEDDFGLVPGQARLPEPQFSCEQLSLLDPGRHDTGEWNSLVMDIDLTKYPGAKAGDSFVRRSKPLAKGSMVMFEIRGSFLITRQ